MYNVHCILHCINFINTQAAYVVVKKISLVQNSISFLSFKLIIILYSANYLPKTKETSHDIWTKNTNLRKPWWTYCTKLFEKINYSLKVSAFFSLIAFNCIAKSCHYINQSRDNKWLCDTVKSYKTKKSETLRLEFTFSILVSKVKKAFMELQCIPKCFQGFKSIQRPLYFVIVEDKCTTMHM